MKSKSIVPTRIEVEERSGTDILVVEDGNQEQYTTPDPYLVNRFQELSDDQEERYIGEKWEIAYELTDENYKDFRGFLSKAVRQESADDLEERVEQLESVIANVETDVNSIKDMIQEMRENE